MIPVKLNCKSIQYFNGTQQLLNKEYKFWCIEKGLVYGKDFRFESSYIPREIIFYDENDAITFKLRFGL